MFIYRAEAPGLLGKISSGVSRGCQRVESHKVPSIVASALQIHIQMITIRIRVLHKYNNTYFKDQIDSDTTNIVGVVLFSNPCSRYLNILVRVSAPR